MDDLHSMMESLRSVGHFSHFAEVDLRAIVMGGQIRRFRPGEMIFTEGEPCAGMHVLIRGHVHLCRSGPQGQMNIVAEIKPVIMFNEVPVLDGGPNPASALAIQDCLIWQISFNSFQALIKRYPQLGLSLLRVLAKRNRQMIENYADLSFRSVQARVAKLLLDLSNNGQNPVERREHSINEMAAKVASVPEVISRSLNVFKSLGLIESGRTKIVIIDAQKLASLAQIDLQGSE